jgi:putative flippase GtrA
MQMTGKALVAPFKFALVGLANSAIGLATIYVLKLFEVSDVVANICGYSIGLTVSFVFNRNWTFHHSGTVLPAALRFLSVFAIAYLANLGTVLGLIRLLGLNSYAAQTLGIVPYTTLFYLGSRYVAFRLEKSVD